MGRWVKIDTTVENTAKELKLQGRFNFLLNYNAKHKERATTGLIKAFYVLLCPGQSVDVNLTESP